MIIESKKYRKQTVAEYLAIQTDKCGKTQKEVAQEVGYENPKIIIMFNQGLTKVPLNKILPLSQALDVDPAHLLRLVLSEYAPGMLETIEEIFQIAVLTKNECDLINTYRNATNGTDASAVVCDARDVIALVMI